MLLTYRGVKYDNDAALRRYLLNQLKKEDKLKAEIKRDLERVKTPLF
jgi:hypothetical protein